MTASRARPAGSTVRSPRPGSGPCDGKLLWVRPWPWPWPWLTGVTPRFRGEWGAHAIFNLPDGICDVAAYAKGVSYAPVTVTVAAAGTNPVTADLARSAVPTATVSGSVQFVSSTFWDYTSVLLVVDSTYDASRVRGIAPRPTSTR